MESSINQEVDKEYAIGVISEVFDQNKDGKINEAEFIEGCKKWINEANNDNSKGRKPFRKASQFFMLICTMTLSS